MHPLAAIGLALLAAIARMGTILTLLVAFLKARRHSQAEVRRAVQGVEVQSPDRWTVQI